MNDPEARAAYEATLAAIEAKRQERERDLAERVDDAFRPSEEEK